MKPIQLSRSTFLFLVFSVFVLVVIIVLSVTPLNELDSWVWQGFRAKEYSARFGFETGYIKTNYLGREYLQFGIINVVPGKPFARAGFEAQDIIMCHGHLGGCTPGDFYRTIHDGIIKGECRFEVISPQAVEQYGLEYSKHSRVLRVVIEK